MRHAYNDVYCLRGISPIFSAATKITVNGFRQRKRVKSGLFGFSYRDCDIVQIVQKYCTVALTRAESPLLGTSNFLKIKNYNFHKNIWKPEKVNIRYRGKSFRVAKQRIKGRLVLRFSRCHKTYFYFKYFKLYYRKNKYFKLRTWRGYRSRNKMARVLYDIRRYNVYNKRGLHPRFFFIFLKKGKVSAYR